MVLLARFADSQSLDLEPIRTFQTVSLGSSCIELLRLLARGKLVLNLVNIVPLATYLVFVL